MATDDREQQFDRALARHLRDAFGGTCPDAEILAAYHERTLSLEEMAKWKEHIAACERCQEELSLVEQSEGAGVGDGREKERDLTLATMTMNAMVGRAAPVEQRMEEEALPPSAGAVAVVTPARRIRTQWKWIVPLGAIAAGVIVWIGSIEIQKQRRQVEEPVQMAENRRAAEAPPMDQPAAPRTDALEPKQNEANEVLRDAGGTGAVVTPKTAPKISQQMSSPGMVAPGTVPEVRGQLDKKKEATGQGGQGFGNGIGASAPMAPAPVSPDDMKREKDESLSLKEGGAAVAGRQMKPPVAAANQAPAASPQKSRTESTSKLSAGSAGSNLSIITGTVLDPSGAAISGALITAIETSSGASKTTVADAAGQFQLTLPSDQYKVIVAHAGFAQSERTLTLQPKQNEQLQVYLKLGTAAESVEVSAAATTVNTSSASISSAGKNVDALMTLAAADAQSIVAPDKKVGWRVGDAGKIERTTDRGKTWKLQTSGVSTDLRTGSATSGKVCWIVGKAGTILLTTDGGKHWKQIASPIPEDWGGIHAADALHASIWDVPNRKSYETSDGGATWKRTANE